jgi:hypothetical protein
MKTLRIAMTEEFDSLNVAAASAVALHHFFQRPTEGAVSPVLSAALALDRRG